MDGMDPPVQVVELAPAVCTRCACVSVLTQYAPVLQSPPCLGVGHAVCKCCQQQGCGSHSHHRRCWCRCRCWCRRCGCGSRSEVSPSLGCRAHGAYEDHQSTSGVEEPRCRGGNPGIQLVQCMPCTATILTGAPPLRRLKQAITRVYGRCFTCFSTHSTTKWVRCMVARLHGCTVVFTRLQATPGGFSHHCVARCRGACGTVQRQVPGQHLPIEAYCCRRPSAQGDVIFVGWVLGVCCHLPQPCSHVYHTA